MNPPAAPARSLIAVSRDASDELRRVDLNDIAGDDGVLFVRDGVGMAGRGVALRVPADEAVAVLAGIEHRDETTGAGAGDGPVLGSAADSTAPGDRSAVLPRALGALPYRPGAPAELIVPELLVVKAADGRCWTTTVTVDGTPGPEVSALLDVAPPPVTANAFTIEPVTPLDVYLAAVAAARDAVRAGGLVKAVIAREIVVRAADPISRHGVLHRLKAAFGSSFRFAVDGFVGASPELLVEVDGATVRSMPLAGTAPRATDPDTDAAIRAQLIASTKDQVEHRVVIEVIHDTLLPWCSYLDWEPEPWALTVANVHHLATRMEGHLSSPRPSVVELARALAPTPALGGHPRAEALALIDAVEGVDRDLYGGAVGWVDAAGNGTWAVAIRCAQLDAERRVARLHAGGGIVADSEPAAELAETQAKFQAMLSALIRA